MRVNAVWKYRLCEIDEVTLSMPAGAQVLCVQTQGNEPHLWALVEPSQPLETRTFSVIGTGSPFDPEGRAYVGTWQRGAFVWHLFEKVG